MGGDILVYTFWRGGGQAELLHDVVGGLLHFRGRWDGFREGNYFLDGAFRVGSEMDGRG